MANSMMMQPTQAFCAANRLPYPAPFNMIDPNEYTLNGFGLMLRDMLDRSAGVADAKSMQTVINMGAHKTWKAHERILCVMIPVCFSPANAVKIGDIIKRVEGQAQKSIPATFLFGDGPAYKLNNDATYRAISALARQGFEIGLMQSLYSETTAQALRENIERDHILIQSMTHKRVNALGFHSIGSAKTRELGEELEGYTRSLNLVNLLGDFNTAEVAICATRHGLYAKGHPLDLYTKDKTVGVIQVASDWYSEHPLSPWEKIWEMRGMTDMAAQMYLERIGQPLFGASGTSEPLSIARVHKHIPQMV